MKLATSFTGTRGVRYPSPDVARGFMLLLIALANIPFWTNVTHASAPSDAVDTAWLWVRSLLVDSRAYPLFAMLFGFGLVTMVNRRIASGTSSYLSSLPGVEDGREPTSQEAAWAREQATVDARRLVRRRGLWMVLFGAVHAVLFSGDIIGPYGLVAVIFAGWITRKHWKRAVAFCIFVVVAGTTTFLNMGSFLASQGATSATDAHQGAGASTGTVLSYVSDGLLAWGGSLISALFFSMIVPAMFLGARLADTDLITHPERHRRLLLAVGLGGLGIGAAGGIGFAVWAAGGSLVAWTMPAPSRGHGRGRGLRLVGTVGPVRRRAEAGWPADGAAPAGIQCGAPLHDGLPQPDLPLRHHLHGPARPDRDRASPGRGPGRRDRVGGLAGDSRSVRRPGARRSRRPLRDPAAHRRGPQ